MRSNGIVLLARIPHPEVAVHAVALDEAFLAVEHKARKTASLVGLDHLNLQQRRLRMERVLVDERPVSFSSVDVTFLVEIEIAEIHVNHVRVLRLSALVEVLIDTLGARHIREAQGQDPERILDQFLLGAA